MNGADLVANWINEQGLKKIFTFPGGTIAPIYDALVRKGVEIVCTRHEQGAGYAALAIARLTRKPQVVMVTSGPGVTNLVTVIADAFFDSTPLIAITGQVGTADLLSGRKVRQTGFQQVDTVALMKPVTKAVFQPQSASELQAILLEAFTLTTDGRFGPVVIDIPMNVQNEIFTDETKTGIKQLPKKCSDERAVEQQITKAAALIAAAQRPVFFTGQGLFLADAVLELRQLVELRSIPVVNSILGLGSIPTDNELALGFIGHTGNQYAALAINQADVVIAVGARLDVRQTGSLPEKFLQNGTLIRIDVDCTEMEFSRVAMDVAICSDAKDAMGKLLNILKDKPIPDLQVWHNQIKEWKIKFPLEVESQEDVIKPQQIISSVDRLSASKAAVVCTGVGSHQQWAARHFTYDYPKRALLTSGGHGAMGYDLPSAIGAQLARPNDLVICFVGDGSFQINIQELQTIIDLHTPIKIFVLDNQRLAMVSQFQKHNWGTDPTTGNKSNPDFAKVAEAYGIKAWTLRKQEEIEDVVRTALAYEGPTLVHCVVASEENVVPMLLAGQTLDKMWPY
jgi:acetolactate synthase-1/2/3 large subunit